MRASGKIVLMLSAGLFIGRAELALAGTPGKDGAATINTANTVVNCYTTLAADAAAGSTSVTVTSAAALACPTLEVGDLILIVQMQGATIDTTDTAAYGTVTALDSAGLYEFAVVASVSGNVVSFTGCGGGATTPTPLANSYTVAGSTQIIRVPQYSALTVTSPGSIVPPAWNGTTGGVVAIHVDTTATLDAAGSINVSGLGFRGGRAPALFPVTFGATTYRGATNSAGGEKGEGIAGDWTVYDGLNGRWGRGAPANGGGGDTQHNSGGGGGANGDPGGAHTGAGVFLPASTAWLLDGETASTTGGGRGGYSYANTPAPGGPLVVGPGSALWGGDQRRNVGGRGGHPVAGDAASRLVMGGGGGGADPNDSVTGANGGAGGGLVILIANTVSGSGSILSDGESAANSGTADGVAGGGGGGSIVVSAASSSGISLSAAGGTGASKGDGGSGQLQGPGGGGGGGFIAVSGGLVVTAADVPGGVQGIEPTATMAPFPQNGATQGAAGQTATVPSVQGGCFVVTRASFDGLRRDAAGTIEFGVSRLEATLGFRLHGMAAKTGERVRIGEGMIPVTAEQRLGRGPHFFSVPSAIDLPYVVIEEVELSGRSRWIGPVGVDDAHAAGLLDRAIVRATARDSAPFVSWAGREEPAVLRAQRPREVPPSPPTAAGTVPGVKIETDGAGYVSVRVADLVAAGLSPTANFARLRLYSRGAFVAFTVVPGPAIRFYASPFASDFTARNTYVLWQSSGAPPAPSVATTRSGPPAPATYTRAERNVFYAPFVHPAADPWVWAIGGVSPNSVSFDLPGFVPSSANRTVVIHLVGGSNHAHRVSLSLNGRYLGVAAIAGRVPGQRTVSVPGSVLRASGNTLTFTDNATGADPESALVLLDRVDLGFRLPAQGAAIRRIAPYDPSLGLPAAVDYLAMAPKEYLGAAQRLADGRRGQVPATAALDVERAYDAFSSGIVEPNAIREALRRARTQNAVKFAVLVGTDTFDPRNFSGAAPTAFIPSLLSYDDDFGRVPSEYLYADVDGAGAPELAIGRLPARSLEQAEALVTKALDASRLLENAELRHVIAIDDSGMGDSTTFEAEAAVQSGAFPTGEAKVFVRVDGGADEAREQLSSALQEGAMALHYFGHGSVDYWADEQVLNAESAAALEGTDKGFVAFAWNCQSNWYQSETPSLGEELLAVSDGGAVASLGPVGNTNPDFHYRFAKETYKQFLSGVPLGEAVRRARAALPRGTYAHVLNGWSLLGDPLIQRPTQP